MDILDLWPLALCTIEIGVYFVVGVVLIFLNELQSQDPREITEVGEYAAKITEKPTVLRRETWDAWAGAVHPGWLLGVRIFAFLYLSGLLILVFLSRDGWLDFFYYYTEWTLALLIFYFGWATFVSIFEYNRNLHKHRGTLPDVETADLQARLLQPNQEGESWRHAGQKDLNPYSLEAQDAQAGYLGYTLQILFQTVAPAVVLTDGVYWTFLYPFFPENFPHTASEWNLHAVNAMFLLIDLFLNSMRFPWFRAAYFFVYSCIYVFFQWSIHVLGLVGPLWPYPFMTLSTAQAPLWYLAIGILHVSAYAVISFLNRLKLILQDRVSESTPNAKLSSIFSAFCPGG